MRIDLSHAEFQAAVPIMKQIEAAGYAAYFVGGSVRDALLGLPIHDVDIATSAYPAEVKTIFPKTVDTGIQHGTVMVLWHGVGYEVTTFRTESGYQDFRRPDHVTFVRSLEEDLKRRDFTVNALAATADGDVVDLFDGLDDLRAKRLRAVGDAHARFHEDALRMMRAVRFQSQLGFSIAPDTVAAIAANAPLLANISVERTAAEFTRLMLGIDRAGALAHFIETGLYAYAPQFADQAVGLQRLAALPEQQVTDPTVAWTLVVGALKLPVKPLLKAWKQANAMIATVTAATTLLNTEAAGLSDWALYQAGPSVVAVAVTAADWLQPNANWAEIQTRANALPIHAKSELAINGAQLMAAGFSAGPQLGRVLAELERAVVMQEMPNETAALQAAAANLRPVE